MIKKLTRVGNSLALVIERPILELLDVDDQTALEVRTDGRTLVIAPVDDSERSAGRERKFRKALADVNRRHAKALKRLAE